MAGSEDLEQGLIREVEALVGNRLSTQQEELLRVQSQISETLAGLAERMTADSDDELAVVLSEYVRRAREQGQREAAQASAPARETSDMAILKAAVEDIDHQRSQADILNTLVNRAASFAPRVAFFVVKNERATGWRARGLEGTVGDDAVREISLPLAADTVLGRVHSSRETWSGAPGANAEDHELTAKLGDEPPQRMVAVPLMAREKCVAVLYADSAGLEGEAINLEALETLVRITGMAVELLTTKRPAPSSPAPAAAAPPAHPPRATETPRREAASGDAPAAKQTTPSLVAADALPADDAATPRDAAGKPSSNATTPERASDETPRPAPPAEFRAAPETVDAAAPTIEATAAEAAPFETADGTAGSAAPEISAEAREERGIVPVVDSDATVLTPAPARTDAPLGARRRFGQADSELPVEVNEEEKRYHQDARRFARLLVSEIKLYNETKVREGRDAGDIYGRLREDIDRSRQMYDKRVHPAVAPRYDYFHHELVNTLAEGDTARLGADYPGAAVSA